jgi:ABC-type glutathione transport system ATPase component
VFLLRNHSRDGCATKNLSSSLRTIALLKAKGSAARTLRIPSCRARFEDLSLKLIVPELSLIVLVGPSGCGKSTFARKHFKATEVLSSDFCRGLVCDDENSQAATGDALPMRE